MRYVMWLAEEHRLPVFDRESPGVDYEFHQPPLYYLICLPTYLLSYRNPETAEQALRFVTILISLPLLYLTFALARALARDCPHVAPAAAAVVAFLPMHLSVSASVSNDALTEVFFVAALLLIAHHVQAAARFREGETRAPASGRSMAFVGLIIGLGVLTKSIAVLLLPVAWAAAAFAARGAAGYDWRQLARDVALSTGIALVVAGWWLVRNQVLYGDLLLHRAFVAAFRDRPSPQGFMERFHLSLLPYIGVVITWTAASVVGVFGPVVGNRFVFFPTWTYLSFALVGLVGGIGFARYLSRTTLTAWQRQAWWLSGILAALLLLSFIRFNLSFFQAQARYMFPALPPAALAFCLGVQTLAPTRWQRVGLALVVAALFALALVGLPVWVIPQFHL